MERVLFDQNGVLITNFRIVFKGPGNDDTTEELTFFVPHVTSVKIVTKTIQPFNWGALMIILGVLTLLGSIVGFVSISQGASIESGYAFSALAIGIIFIIYGIWLNSIVRVQKDYSVVIRTSGGEVKVLIDLDSDNTFSNQVVAAVTKAVALQPTTSPEIELLRW